MNILPITVELVFKVWLKEESTRVQATRLTEIQMHQCLALDIDDFSIRNIPTTQIYNTDLNDLRGDTLLNVILSRTTTPIIRTILR
jgi:hypothetical protein